MILDYVNRCKLGVDRGAVANFYGQETDPKAQHLSDADNKLYKLIYHQRWWGILSFAAQRAVALNLLGGDWAPAVALEIPSTEELLCATVATPIPSRMR